MINLKNTCILVKTEEENEMLLKEAEKQGFHWYSKGNCKPLPGQHFPDILKFCNNKDVVHSVRIGVECDAFYEVSELLGTKEMTAREFVEWYLNVDFLCGRRNCDECVLGRKNTKCNNQLCSTCNWKNNIDELLEIAKSGRITVPTPEEKAIEDIEKLIQSPYRGITGEIKESLKLAVEKLKEVNDNGEINT